MTKTCQFCNKTLQGQRSVEHVFPLWLQERYGLSNGLLLQTHFSEKGAVISDRYHTLNRHVFGQVCANCNNGWMSRLEINAKPLLVGLADSTIQLNDLNSAQCLVLGKWACKTAYVLHGASNYRTIVAPNHLMHLTDNENSLPTSVWSFGCQHQSTEPFVWWQGPTWHMEGDEDFASEDTRNLVNRLAYKICFSIKDLILIVAHNPLPDSQLVLWKGVHYPIHPEHGPVYWYERDGFPYNHTQEACIAFMVSMGIKQKDDRTSACSESAADAASRWRRCYDIAERRCKIYPWETWMIIVNLFLIGFILLGFSGLAPNCRLEKPSSSIRRVPLLS